MPSYLYRCDSCGNERRVHHSMDTTPKVTCERCSTVPPPSMRIVVGADGIPAARAPDRTGYQPCLARYPNDPTAYVDGPRALSKLIDDRKRRGWGDPVSPSDVASKNTTPPPAPPLPLEG